MEETNLSQCVSSVCEDMGLIKDKNITLLSSIEPDIFVSGNYELLTRMVINLISNAYRYGKENGKIEVSLKRLDSSIVLSVKDDGVGIDKSSIGKIWDRFYRADPSRSDGSTGLGLAFVREIAEIHGAEARVESQKGIGSCFSIIFKNSVL